MHAASGARRLARVSVRLCAVFLIFIATSLRVEGAWRQAGMHGVSQVDKLRGIIQFGKEDSVYHYESELARQAYLHRQYDAAERLYVAALMDAEKQHVRSDDLPILLTNLGTVYRAETKFDSALPLFMQALNITGRRYRADPHCYKYVEKQYAVLLAVTGHKEEAKLVEESSQPGGKPLYGTFLMGGVDCSADSPLFAFRPPDPFSSPDGMRGTSVQEVPVDELKVQATIRELNPCPRAASDGLPVSIEPAACEAMHNWWAMEYEAQIVESKNNAALRAEWNEWLLEVQRAIDWTIVGAPVRAVPGSYHLDIGSDGEIREIAVISSSSKWWKAQEKLRAALLNLSPQPFPTESKMSEIHIILDVGGRK